MEVVRLPHVLAWCVTGHAAADVSSEPKIWSVVEAIMRRLAGARRVRVTNPRLASSIFALWLLFSGSAMRKTLFLREKLGYNTEDIV